MNHTRPRAASYVLIALIVILLVAHQWDWGFKPDQLVMGVVPYELMNQIIISLAAAGTWWFAVCCAWPRNLDDSVAAKASAAAADAATATDADV